MRRALGASLLVALAAAPALAQTPEQAKKLDDLERKAADQADEIERLRRERLLDVLRRSGDAPPHVEPTDAAAPAALEKPEEPSFEWGYDDGFFVSGTLAGEKYVLRPRAYIQLDFRAFPHSQANAVFATKGVANDRFILRRAVIGFTGRFGPFDFFFEAEPVRGTIGLLPIQNVWLEWHGCEELRVRAGHFIPPFALADSFTAPTFSDFPEEPMIDQAVAFSFRPGAMAFGSFGGGLLSYFLAANNELDANGGVSGDPIVTARLASKEGPLELGASGAWERRAGTQTSLQGTTPGQFRFFAPVKVRGWTQRYEVDAAITSGPFFGSGEFAWAHQERRRIGSSLVVQGAYVTLGWLFAGPLPGTKKPHVPFEDWSFFSLDLEKHRNARNVGAELVCRVEWIGIGADDVKGDDAKAVSVGVNVYPMENVKLMLDWVHVHVGDQSTAERAHSREADEILVRAQLEF